MKSVLMTAAATAILVPTLAGCGGSADEQDAAALQATSQSREFGQQTALAAQGKHIFRFETFGDEAK